MNPCGLCGQGVYDDEGYCSIVIRLPPERYVGSKYHPACMANVNILETIAKLKAIAA